MKNLKKTTFKIWFVRFLFCAAVIATYKTFDDFSGIVRGFDFILGVLTPFIIGGFFAFFLFPPSRKVEALLMKSKKNLLRKKARPFSVLLVVLAFLLILGALLTLFIPMLYQNIVVFISSIPGYINNLYNMLQQHFPDANWLNQAASALKNFLTFENISQYVDLGSYASGITGVFVFLFHLLIGFIISIYLLLERAKIKQAFVRVCKLSIKEHYTERTIRLIQRISKVIYSFVYGQALDAFLIGCIVGITLAIFRIPNAIVLGMVYFLFALIPYFGPFIGVACVALFTLLSGSFEQFIIALIIVLILQQVDGNLLYPRVIGNAVGIRPLYVILGVTLFGGLFGFAGLFFGPPLMSIIIELSEEFVSNKERKLAAKHKKQTVPPQDKE